MGSDKRNCRRFAAGCHPWPSDYCFSCGAGLGDRCRAGYSGYCSRCGAVTGQPCRYRTGDAKPIVPGQIHSERVYSTPAQFGVIEPADGQLRLEVR